MRKSNNILLRHYIHDRLYHPQQGYFCKPNLQVGEMIKPLDFKTFIGYDDYQKALFENYPQNAWLTPSQIFKPYYGMTVANYITQAHQRYQTKEKKEKDINIVEVGAGTGSAAQSILFYFKNYENKLYQRLNYTVVEISSVLCDKIQKKLRKDNQELIQNKRIKILNDDIMNYKRLGLHYLLFFQVLDNMPHDRVTYDKQLKKYTKQTTVSLDTNQQLLVDIDDKYIKQCLEFYTKLPSKVEKPTKLMNRMAQYIANTLYRPPNKNQQILFLPTYFLQFLINLHNNLPESHLIINDFDYLSSTIPGILAPIVSKKGAKSHEKQDYGTYLTNRGEADIFFPTNFELVKLMYKSITKKPARHLKSYEFIEEFSKEQWAMTRSGYNPFRQDFLNTSFFITDV